MYKYFGVGPQLLEDVDDMFPRFLRWLPKYCLSTSPKCSLQAWCMVIDNLGANDVSFFVVVCLGILCSCAVLFGYEEHVQCAWAQELNGS